jgi:ABC-type multidrug transport system fused ATPase/permease subunit
MPKRSTHFSADVYNTIFQAYKPYLGRITLMLFVGFLGRFLVLSNLHFIAKTIDAQAVIDRVQLRGLIGTVFMILAAAVACALVYRILFSRYSALAVSQVHDETVLRVSRFPLTFFDKNPVGKITTRFSSDYGNAFRLFGGPLAEYFSIIFDLISIAIIVVLIHPIFLISLGIAAAGFSLILKFNQSQLRVLRKTVSIQRAPSITHFSETAQGAMVIRLSQNMKSFLSRFKELNAQFLNSKLNVFTQVFKFSMQLNLLSLILFVFNGLFCIHLFEQKIIGAGMTTLVLGLTVIATGTLQMFFEWYSQFDEAFVGIERMDDYLRMPMEPGFNLPKSARFITHSSLSTNDTPIETSPGLIDETSHLSIENLSVTYSGSSAPALNQVSFNLRKGQKLGIVGKTGAGKSSLMAALLKLYPLSSGRILVNQRNYTNLTEYRRLFSVITQDSFFIRGTLYENLDPEKQTAKQNLMSIMSLIGYSASLDMPIEENGKNLSSGERQVISLIRGLIKNAEIFIFDEATAHIDPQSEILIQNAIEKLLKDKTQIRIAHRLQTVTDCDVLIWLENGSIKKIGPPQEILEGFMTTLY